MSSCLIFQDYFSCLKLIVYVKIYGKTSTIIFGRIKIAKFDKSDYKVRQVGGLDSTAGVGCEV